MLHYKKKTHNPFSWKNKPIISIPKSLTQSFLPITKSIVVSDAKKKKFKKKKSLLSKKII